MKVNFDGSVLKVNDALEIKENTDGQLTVEFGSGGSVAAYDNPWPGASSSWAIDKPTVEYDENDYQNGNNGLTLSESVTKAYWRVVDETWAEFTGVQVGSYTEVWEVIEKIVRDYGRQEVYRIAGTIKSLYNKGYYKGVPLSLVFSLWADDRLSYPDELKESVWTVPSGRYA